MSTRLLPKIKLLAITAAAATLAIACNPDPIIEDLTSQEDHVDQHPVSYDHENEIIEGEYIVLLKTDQPSTRYPELITADQKDDIDKRNIGDRNLMINMKATET